MNNALNGALRDTSLVALSLLAGQFGVGSVQANPTGGTVATGSATFNSAGSQFTVNTGSASTFINWQSFNIGLGETTTFVQPTSTSVVWNQVNGANPSQLLGTLNANGYVILQNPNGIYVGGAAVLNAHGLVLTTAPTSALNLASGAWEFDAPPPTAAIINYGQINIAGGGSAYLIANTIQNSGTISAEQGKIGLYAGEQVLVSTSPDGRGLNAQVTLPQGSVDNEGKLIADGGSILMQAKTVNQGGLIQANTVQDVNGVIGLLASDSVNLSASSTISAQGAATGVSTGGTVTVKSDNTFSDAAGSTISVAGGTQGGNGGQLEISAANLGGIQSQIDGQAASGFTGGALTIDPTTLALDAATTIASLGLSALTISADNITIDSSWAIPTGVSALDITSSGTITVSSLTTLAAAGSASTYTLSAGNNIVFTTGSGIKAPSNWSLNLLAGTALAAGATPAAGSDGIYLLGTAYLQTQDGNINLTAANEVQVGAASVGTGSTPFANAGNGAIRTLGGGSINVTAQYGDVNTGGDTSGYNYYKFAPYYTPFTVNLLGTVATTSTLGGISTAAGGNVTIKAGGNVTSYFASSSTSQTIALADPGTGAFGPQPGNVTITAGGTVYGDYIVANGAGSITGNNIGSANVNVALSLIAGSWALNAPNGNIYLQEVRNPNGIFDNLTTAGNHYFDYDAQAAVTLDAGIGVYLTGFSLPRPTGQSVPIIYPSSLDITAGSGGVNVQNNVILFPSVNQNLDITTTDGGALNGVTSAGDSAVLSMSDTSTRAWTSSGAVFTTTDIGSTPLEINNPNPVKLNISGDMENLQLYTDKATQIQVGGDLLNCAFSGQNLHAGDVTSIDVTGGIFNEGSFTWDFLSQPIAILPGSDWVPSGYANSFLSILYAAVDTTKLGTVAGPATPAQIIAQAENASLFGHGTLDKTFTYDPATGRLTFIGPMAQTLETLLEQPSFTVLERDGKGNPLVVNGQFVTDTVTYSWVSASAIQTLYTASQTDVALDHAGNGYEVGGPGEFDISATSISLGNTLGIFTYGAGGRYGYLAPYTPSGANLTVSVAADQTVNGVTIASLDMPASTIAALGGGDVTVTSTGGSMDLGSLDLLDAEALITAQHGTTLGIYSSASGNVNVTAQGDINVDTSRIAAFDGGNLNVESLTGSVNAGSAGTSASVVTSYFVNAKTGRIETSSEQVYADGIVAETLSPSALAQIPGIIAASVPGNITVTTPQGDINADQGGILQESLNGNDSTTPTITLSAGTLPTGKVGDADYSPGHTGNINLGNSGAIGKTVNATANGNISGLVVSIGNSTIVAAQNFNGTVVAGGSASLAAGGSVSGMVIGLGGVNASGAGGVTAELLGNNVSVNGGASQNTFGATATATATAQNASAQAGSDQRAVASNDSGVDDDEKKKRLHPLMQRVKRVTVILPAKA